jgi:peptide/nickel transport system ATP-binding protein
MENALLEVRDLSVTYRTNNEIVRAVNDVTFTLFEKETLGLVGETGAGKTTLALSILRLLPKDVGSIDKGQILFQGKNLLEQDEDYMRAVRGGVVSMIFQDPMTSLNPVLTVGKQIAEVMEFDVRERRPQAEIDKKVDEILRLVGISPTRKNDYPHQFSGGMKQRVVIAMALICNPVLVIADEPTTALDVTIQAQTLNIIDDLREKLGTSMIMITHDLGIVAETCDRVGIMYAGEIVEIGTTKDIFTNEKHHPYTLGLMKAIPNIESKTDRLQTIPGLMPDPTNLLEGCKFHDRCQHCMDICKLQPPPPYVDGTHTIRCHLYRSEK